MISFPPFPGGRQVRAGPLREQQFEQQRREMASDAPAQDEYHHPSYSCAIDRNKIVQLYGGPSFATATCQPLAPGLPGYRRYCPYTLHLRPNGAWTAPDLAKAQHLITASGTHGERIDVWAASDGFVPASVPAYIADVLRTLGYRVHLHLVPFASITGAMRRHFQLSVDGSGLGLRPHHGG